MAAPEIRPRGARLPRSARRTQLLGAAREVFVAQGYHAAAMDEIAERAGVSKPVLYQHFPSKRDLYLALLEQHTDELVEATRRALASTSDNKQRVAATMDAFYAFIDSESESFRLVFESDFTSDPEVRELLETMQRRCAEAVAEVIEEDTGLSATEAHLLAVGLTGMSHVTARWWLQAGRPVPREAAAALVSQLSWRGIGGFPKADGRTEGKAGPA
jgi:AcrR family transcriptional regulator